MVRKTAKELLAASFRELAEKKSIDKITVGEIARNCGYSPATFYRNFKDKYDLIAWDYAKETERIMSRIDGKDYPWRQTLLDGVRHCASQREYLANLFQHTLAVSGKNALEKEEELYARVYCLGTVSLICEWILGKYDCVPEELARVFENSLPDPLRVYLL